MSLVLRLLVDPNGALESGELVDLDGRPHGRFVGWDGLIRKVREWLDEGGSGGSTGAGHQDESS